MKILVHTDPQPNARGPEFVKKAYAGLVLEAWHYEPPDSLFTNGVYLVYLTEFLAKMKEHNPLAYEWHESQWGSIEEISKRAHRPITLPFPRECCEEIGTIN